MNRPISREDADAGYAAGALLAPIRAECGRCGCIHALILAEPSPRGVLVCPRCSWGVEHHDDLPVHTRPDQVVFPR